MQGPGNEHFDRSNSNEFVNGGEEDNLSDEHEEDVAGLRGEEGDSDDGNLCSSDDGVEVVEDVDYFNVIDDIENSSEDEGLEDYKRGGYHTVHVG